MEAWKKMLLKLLFPGATVTFLSIPVSAALLFYTFAYAGEDGPVAYLSYTLSAYATLLVCVQIPRLVRGARALLHRNRFLHRYLTDIPFRMRLSLYLSFGLNLLYAVIKLFFGVYYRSIWFGTFGVYYALLTVMRFLLVWHVKRSDFGKEPVSELKRYRLCGAILIPMTAALTGVIVLVIHQNEGFYYPGHLIYAVALYAFYTVTAAGVHIVRFRACQSPVLSAATVIRLAAALVSLFSLETAMLSQFGGSDDSAFRLVMIASTGAAICAGILGISIFMIVHASRRLNAPPSNR